MVVLVVPSFAAGGFLTGFLNEKIFNGSILPGICLQAAGLILTSFLMVSGGGMQAEPIEISGFPADFATVSEYIIFETDEPPV